MLRDDWSGVGRQNLQNAILQDFKNKKCNVKVVKMDTQTAKEIAEIQALYGLVHKTMDQRTFGPHQNMAEAGGFTAQAKLDQVRIIRGKDANKAFFVDMYTFLQKGDLRLGEMKGAWAGELGQLQFLPSNYE